MRSEWMGIVATYVELLSLATYVGGSFVVELVLAPAQKAIPPSQQQVLGEKIADRLLWLVWPSLGLLLVSAVAQTFPAGTDDVLAEGLLSTSYGRTFLAFLVLWAILVVNGIIVTFVLRPKVKARIDPRVGAREAQVRQEEMVKAAGRIATISRVNLVAKVLLPLAVAGLLWGDGLL